jgi:hypothetical protein
MRERGFRYCELPPVLNKSRIFEVYFWRVKGEGGVGMETEDLSYEDWMKIKGERKLTAKEHKKWRQVYVKRWRLENPEKVKNYTKDWRAKNPEKVKDSSNAYYATHKQQKKEWEIKYYQENKSWIGPRNKIYNDKHKEE